MEPNLNPPIVILCIDDQPRPLLSRSLVLQSKGYSVLAASSAEEGLKLFRENHVDFVISDHLLGSTTGTEIADQMKREKPAIPIIIFSGATEIPEGAKRADLFFSKLEGVPLVLRKVSELLKHHKRPQAGSEAYQC